MATIEQKIEQLTEATIASQAVLAEKESKLSSASAAVEKAKTKLKRLSPEAQQTLQFNDTELPDLMSAKMAAEGEYDEAKKRYDKNQQYLLLFREKASREK